MSIVAAMTTDAMATTVLGPALSILHALLETFGDEVRVIAKIEQGRFKSLSHFPLLATCVWDWTPFQCKRLPRTSFFDSLRPLGSALILLYNPLLFPPLPQGASMAFASAIEEYAAATELQQRGVGGPAGFGIGGMGAGAASSSSSASSSFSLSSFSASAAAPQAPSLSSFGILSLSREERAAFVQLAARLAQKRGGKDFRTFEKLLRDFSRVCLGHDGKQILADYFSAAAAPAAAAAAGGGGEVGFDHDAVSSVRRTLFD